MVAIFFINNKTINNKAVPAGTAFLIMALAKAERAGQRTLVLTLLFLIAHQLTVDLVDKSVDGRIHGLGRLLGVQVAA